MKVFLTGATGFVGSHLAKNLSAEGHEVLCLIRSAGKAAGLAGHGLHFIDGSLENVHDWSASLPACDAVIHVAGLIKARRSYEYYRVNTEGTRHLLAALDKNPPGAFVFVSSIAARGPNRSSDDLVGKGPVSHYGKSKLMAEQLVLKKRGSYPIMIVRPPVVYGPGDRETLTLFKMFKKGRAIVPGTADRRLSFVHVDDLAAVLSAAAKVRRDIAEPIYPADSAGGHSLESLIRSAESVFQKKIRPLVVPLPFIRCLAAFNDLISLVTGRSTFISSDKFKELRQPFWFCSPASCHAAYSLPPFKDLKTGFTETKIWYEQAGWL